MGSKLKLVRNVNHARRFRFLVLMAGCFVVTMAFLVASKPQTPVHYNSGFRTWLPPPQSGDDVVNGDNNGIQGIHSALSEKEDALNSQALGEVEKEEKQVPHVAESNIEKEKSFQREENAIVVESTPKEEASIHELTGTIQIPERKPLCDVSDQRVDVCEMYGDIRIPGNSSSVIFMEPSNAEPKELWQVHPYPRKGDEACLAGVRELTVKASSESPKCTFHHDVPAIVFSVGGYTGNLFHDFTDLLVPLFLTARQFDGEVRFVVTDFKRWWIAKYLPVLQRLSKYPVIDHDKDDEVHCFKQVIVGLRAHKEFHIDPARAPNGYTMIDFTKFMRRVFSVGRETLNCIEDLSARKPRLLIIARKRSRAFTNVDEIVAAAEELGYEVVVGEADAGTNLARFAQIVNSCDVMMGVHGAGLTNFVFLPLNATVIQIVPWGGLEWIAVLDFGNPAKEMGLNYVQYSISIEESTLSEQYPKDHPAFTDPMSFHKRGFHVVRSTFMKNQNVKLDVSRFRDVLWKALEHMMQ
ncbi:unnamed protein product [Musa acuminata subsp. malaccensis]|uniref:(wild Malaysian banana) hypothetical protein n=1 Tax=Musa acuminata subsp. malaccensis TaxID=214687 RepID=A0A804IVW0_MUSAM|nr:PREDICTED: uncharacterized protein LOC103982826 [Musa acuminata subsp. malaccensis]XP_018680058.1 PREDICTED: uncharacterized protein LOC103982826 [Musa acuminata subsp. malaccensis]XP_018680059.1 PREDICTED: uncharacterized protein LOC103982826 [Musa acuminata subsp. malaccensis]XP_018680060.1 PREDICTED: uncharacterized protein LOC103982826 [Musa acuminata subsp. malaccensis]CAG1843897.1 unnamed protein product [Musa acuminata subsp. malaccensis]